MWAQDEIAVLPWLDILLGGRYTSNSEFGDFFSPQTTLLLKPGNFRGRFTYTRGFRSPILDEVAFNFVEPGGVGVVGNPDLEPEKSTSFTTNAEYYWERAKLGASVFRHDVSNLIEFLPRCTAAEAASLSVPSSLCFKAANITEARSQGFELEAGVKPLEWLSLESGYMYLDARDQTTDAFLFRRSPHAWKTRIRMEYAGWDLTTRMRYFSSFGFTDLNRNNRIDPHEKAPANLQLDVRLARVLKQGIELYGGVENLTAARMNVSAGLLPPPGVRLWFVGLRMAL
jgi:outer membrane receptor protein involved in Fe transport